MRRVAWALVPGLVLQGLGLGIVLTVNDPTGLTAVPDEDSGQAAGMINTAEQFGGAIGIASLLAIELGYYFRELDERLAAQGLGNPTKKQYDEVRDFILEAEQKGLDHVRADGHRQGRRRRPPEGPRRRLRADLLHHHRDRAARRDRLLHPRAEDHPHRRGRSDLQPPLALDLRQRRPHAGGHEAPSIR